MVKNDICISVGFIKLCNFKFVTSIILGIAGVSLKIISDCTFQSINDFCNSKTSSLAEIQLVDKDVKMVLSWGGKIDDQLINCTFCKLYNTH